MKIGTLVKLNDGTIGTVVYHGLDGYGIIYGKQTVDKSIIEKQNPLFGKAPNGYPYYPDIILNDGEYIIIEEDV